MFYFVEAAVKKFFNDMMNKCKYCRRVIEGEFTKPLAMPKNDHEDFK